RSAGAAFASCCSQADHRTDRGRAAGAQLPDAAGRSGDLGAQHGDYRDDPGLSAHRRDPADSRSAEGIRAAGGWRVASRGRSFVELLNQLSELRFLKKEAPARERQSEAALGVAEAELARVRA